MKLVVDLLQVRVVASGLEGASVLGEAYMVGLGIGVLGCPADLAPLPGTQPDLLWSLRRGSPP